MCTVCYKIRQDNTKFTVSFPGKTLLKKKEVQNPARFSNFRVNSPERLIVLFFFLIYLTALREFPSNIKPSPRKRKKENENKRKGIDR